MESLAQNKSLLYSLLGSSAIILSLACGFLPDIASQLEIIDFPYDVSIITSAEIANINYVKIITVSKSFGSNTRGRLCGCIYC